MNHIWYLCPTPDAPQGKYCLTDLIAVHLDRCGVSFHLGSEDLSFQEHLERFRRSRAVRFLALKYTDPAVSMEENAAVIAMAIVHADGKQWVPPFGSGEPKIAGQPPRMVLVSKSRSFA